MSQDFGMQMGTPSRHGGDCRRWEAAKCGPKRYDQNQTVLWLISMPNTTHITTASRMISRDVLNNLKGLGLPMVERWSAACLAKSEVCLTAPCF